MHYFPFWSCRVSIPWGYLIFLSYNILSLSYFFCYKTRSFWKTKILEDWARGLRITVSSESSIFTLFFLFMCNVLCTVLYCTVLYCTSELYCTVLVYCTLMWKGSFVMYCVLYCSVLYCTVLYCTLMWKGSFVWGLINFLFLSGIGNFLVIILGTFSREARNTRQTSSQGLLTRHSYNTFSQGLLTRSTPKTFA